MASWRASALALLFAASVTTITLFSLLLASLFKLGHGWGSLGGTARLFSGSCSKFSQLNLGAHMMINAVSTGLVASSNFFMRALITPTREDMDRAHERSRFVEIGVLSLRNLRFVSPGNVILWVLLATTSVPLHLVFNSCVLESKASTTSLFALASHNFLTGGPCLNDIMSDSFWFCSPPGWNRTLEDMRMSLATKAWENLSISDCLQRYSATTTPLTTITATRLWLSATQTKARQAAGRWSKYTAM